MSKLEIPAKSIQVWMKPIKQLIASGDSELFSYVKLRDMLMLELKNEDYDELKWKEDIYRDIRYLNPVRVLRVTTFKIIRDVKELESGTLVY